MNVPMATENEGTSVLDRFFRTMMAVPPEVYYFGTVGSIVGSALLFLAGKRHMALFVGEWAPTFMISAIFYKLFHPSGRNVGEQLGAAVNELTR